MGRYCTVDDVRGRYSEIETASKFDVISYHLQYAEMDLDGYLSPFFATPFSSNNLSAKDLAIDLTYIRVANLKTDERDGLRKEIMERLRMYQTGQMQMVTTSGTAIGGGESQAWSTTQNYNPIFGMGNTIDFIVDSSQVYNEAIARGDFR
jgi:hypothetical protein